MTAVSPSSKQSKNAGSEPNRTEPDFLIIGRIIKPHGIKGEVSVNVMTEFPERFDAMQQVFLGDEHSAKEMNIASIRWSNNKVLIRFEGFADRTAVEKLRRLYLKVPIEDAITLEDDSYYHFQLENLKVITDTGRHLGYLVQVLETGANDVYVVKTETGEILLPATHEVILSIDLDSETMTVHLLPGLLNDTPTNSPS